MLFSGLSIHQLQGDSRSKCWLTDSVTNWLNNWTTVFNKPQQQATMTAIVLRMTKYEQRFARKGKPSQLWPYRWWFFKKKSHFHCFLLFQRSFLPSASSPSVSFRFPSSPSFYLLKGQAFLFLLLETSKRIYGD